MKRQGIGLEGAASGPGYRGVATEIFAFRFNHALNDPAPREYFRIPDTKYGDMESA
jgi:hypothetical protein